MWDGCGASSRDAAPRTNKLVVIIHTRKPRGPGVPRGWVGSAAGAEPEGEGCTRCDGVRVRGLHPSPVLNSLCIRCAHGVPRAYTEAQPGHALVIVFSCEMAWCHLRSNTLRYVSCGPGARRCGSALPPCPIHSSNIKRMGGWVSILAAHIQI